MNNQIRLITGKIGDIEVQFHLTEEKQGRSVLKDLASFFNSFQWLLSPLVVALGVLFVQEFVAKPLEKQEQITRIESEIYSRLAQWDAVYTTESLSRLECRETRNALIQPPELLNVDHQLDETVPMLLPATPDFGLYGIIALINSHVLLSQEESKFVTLLSAVLRAGYSQDFEERTCVVLRREISTMLDEHGL